MHVWYDGPRVPCLLTCMLGVFRADTCEAADGATCFVSVFDITYRRYPALGRIRPPRYFYLSGVFLGFHSFITSGPPLWAFLDARNPA